MATIFISYSRPAEATAKAIAQRLSDEHKTVFLDRIGLHPGDDWMLKLHSSLEECQVLLLLLTPGALESKWVFAEYQIARVLGKRIIPVRLDDAEVDEPTLREQWVSVSTDLVDGWQALLDSLGETLVWNEKDKSPYPGLEPFRRDRANVYCGTERSVEEVLSRLRSPRAHRISALGILGPSGSGKSSLLRAGIAPKLRAGGDSRWHVLDLVVRPRNDPRGTLSRAIAGADAGPITTGEDLVRRCRDLLAASENPDARVMVIVDQLEEAVLADTGLLALLAEAVLPEASPVFLLFTLRSDFLESLQAHPSWRTLKFDPYTLPTMSRADLLRTVEEPAKRAGLVLEKGVSAAMVDEAAGEGTLPLLSYALRELWEQTQERGRITLDDCGERGVAGYVGDAVQRIYDDAGDPKAQMALRTALMRLLSVDERHRTVGIEASRKSVELDGNLEPFLDARLVVARTDRHGDEVVSFAHDVVFRGWPQMTRWLRDDREKLVDLRRVERWSEAEALTGSRLDDAGRVDRAYPGELNAEAREAIRRGTFKRWAWRLSGSLVAVTVLALIGSVISLSYNMARAAKQQDDLALVARSRLPETTHVKQASLLMQVADPENTEGWLHSAVTLQGRLSGSTIGRGHSDTVTSIDIVPTRGNELITASQDGTVRFWTVGGQQVGVINGEPRHNVEVKASRDGHWVMRRDRQDSDPGYEQDLSPDPQRTVWLWDRDTLSLAWKHAAQAAAFDSEGTRIATGHRFGNVHLWSVPPGDDPVHIFTAPESESKREVRRLAILESDALVAWSDDRIRVWDTVSHERLLERVTTRAVLATAISGDGSRIAFAVEGSGPGLNVVVFDIGSGVSSETPPLAGCAQFHDLAFTDNEKRLGWVCRAPSGESWVGSVALEDLESPQSFVLDSHAVSARILAKRPRAIVFDNHEPTTALLVDLVSGTPSKPWVLGGKYSGLVEVADDDRVFIGTANPGKIGVVDSDQTWPPTDTPLEMGRKIRDFAWSGELAVASSADWTALVFAGAPPVRLGDLVFGKGSRKTSARFAGNSTIHVQMQGGAEGIWDSDQQTWTPTKRCRHSAGPCRLDTGAEIHLDSPATTAAQSFYEKIDGRGVLKKASGEVIEVFGELDGTFSPSGDRLLLHGVSEDPCPRWTIVASATGAAVWPITGNMPCFDTVEFAGNDRLFASNEDDETYQLLSIANGETRHMLTPGKPVLVASVSKGESAGRVALATESAVFVYDVATGMELGNLPATSEPETLEISADGAVLAVGYTAWTTLWAALDGRDSQRQTVKGLVVSSTPSFSRLVSRPKNSEQPFQIWSRLAKREGDGWVVIGEFDREWRPQEFSDDGDSLLIVNSDGRVRELALDVAGAGGVLETWKVRND